MAKQVKFSCGHKEIKFAVIPDAQGRTDGDHGYTLYYVAGDPDGRWILEDNAGVNCTNYSLTDIYRNQGEELDAEGDRLEGEINAIINSDAGEIANYYTGTGTQGGAGSEAEQLMVEWGWLQPQLLTTAQAADILGISEIRVRQLCQGGRMGRKVGDTWVIMPADIERNRIRVPGRPAVAYEVKGEFGGYKVRKAPTGFVVEFWSAVQGQRTDDKYLLPYGTGGYGHTFERGTDLSAQINDITTYGDALIQALRDGAPHKVLNKGRIVR